MKFRNPETGEVFENIYKMLNAFCSKIPDCEFCQLLPKDGFGFCQKWIRENSVEAARLMGYEVIDEKEDNMEKKDKPLGEWTLKEVKELCENKDECPGCPFYTAENGCMFSGEATSWPLDETETMTAPVAKDINVPGKPDKPRLAEVLGVDENEPIRIVGGGYDTVPFTIADVIASDGGLMAGAVTCAIIHPEYIIRAPRLTEAEMAICKAVGAKWVSRDQQEPGLDDENHVVLWWDKPSLSDCGVYANMSGDDTGTLPASLFPSVHPGGCICVEEADAQCTS